jgi:hypothetical protein
LIREPVPWPARPKVSDATSARFLYLVDGIARAHDPTGTQLEALESAYSSTGKFLSECPEFDGLLLEIHAQGSRQLGTMVRPIDDSREGFDVDLVARMAPDALRRYGHERGPAKLLEDLHTALARYAEAHSLRLHRWERCVTLEYAGGMTADIAPVIDDPLMAAPYGATHGRVPDRKLHLFEPTNPRGYARHFDRAAAISPVFAAQLRFAEAMDSIRADVAPLPNAQEVFERLLCRLIQLIKLHRNMAFMADSRDQYLAPSSVFVTTLAAAAYTVQAPQLHDSPLDLLLDIVETMPLYFQRLSRPDGSEEWLLPNPSAPRDNLASGMNSAARQQAFRWWHQRFIDDLTGILNAIEHPAGMDVLDQKIESAFGRRAALSVRRDQLEAKNLTRQAGKVAFVTATSASVTTNVQAHTFFGRR